MCQEMKEEKDMPELKIALINQHKNLKNKERLITAANNSIGNISTDKKINK